MSYIVGSIVYDLKEIFVDDRARSGYWCQMPYGKYVTTTGLVRYTNPKGCPMLGKKGCPPNSESIFELIQPPYKLVGVKVNITARKEELHYKHMDWTVAQVSCVRYWQPKAARVLKTVAEAVAKTVLDGFVVMRPEKKWVNVFKTAASIGIYLKANPIDYAWQIAIVGRKVRKGGLAKWTKVRE